MSREALDDAVLAQDRPIPRRPGSALRITKAMLNSLTAGTRLAGTPAFEPEFLTAVLVEGRR